MTTTSAPPRPPAVTFLTEDQQRLAEHAALVDAETHLRPADQDEAQQAGTWLHDTDDKILACRGQGHAFPKLRGARGGLPRGIQAARQHDGGYQITSTCRDCGVKRTLTTLPGGVLDLPAKYTYEYPEGYAAPKGTANLTGRRECLRELWRRQLENLPAVPVVAG